MNNRLFVFDTNTLVNGLLFSASKPAQAFRKAREVGFLVCSEATYNELTEVLLRPKFDKYLSHESRQQYASNFVTIETHESSSRINGPKKENSFFAA